MRTRALALLLLVVGLVATVPGTAMAHPASDWWDGTYDIASDVEAITDVADVDITRQSDNVDFVASLPVAATSDMQ